MARYEFKDGNKKLSYFKGGQALFEVARDKIARRAGLAPERERVRTLLGQRLKRRLESLRQPR